MHWVTKEEYGIIQSNTFFKINHTCLLECTRKRVLKTAESMLKSTFLNFLSTRRRCCAFFQSACAEESAPASTDHEKLLSAGWLIFLSGVELPRSLKQAESIQVRSVSRVGLGGFRSSNDSQMCHCCCLQVPPGKMSQERRINITSSKCDCQWDLKRCT